MQRFQMFTRVLQVPMFRLFLRAKRVAQAHLLSAALVTTAAVATTSAAQAQDQLSYEVLAEQYKQVMGADCDGGCYLEDVIDASYARVRLGDFDLRYPAVLLSDSQEAKRFQKVAEGILDLQLAWFDWFDGRATDTEEDKAAKELRAEAKKLSKDLRKWIGSWGKTQLASAAKRRSGDDLPNLDLLELCPPKSKAAAALERYNEIWISGAALGFDLSSVEPTKMVFAPNRDDIVSLACFVGWLDEPNRSIYWTDGLLFWTDFWWGDFQVVALEYPPAGPNGANFRQGIDMSSREKTGMLQHLTQRAAYSLIWRSFGRDIDPAFEAGLAQNLVVSIYEENNTRSGGSTRGKTKRGYSQFIPGGNSEGGILPKNNADSKWREDLGKDHFGNQLQINQKSAGSDVGRKKDRLAHFQLTSDDGGDRHLIQAPFFGKAAVNKKLPPAHFLSDYREFFRAYKSCFVNWLREEAGGSSSKKSHAVFSQLLGRMGEEADFEQVVAEVYGLPLSAADGEENSLEWRFLKWLSKQ